MELKGLQLFPILIVLWTTSVLMISHIFSYLGLFTHAGSVRSLFPRSPFLIVSMTVCAILSSIMAVIVYNYQTQHPKNKDSNRNTWYQRALLAIGLTACLGLTITVLTLIESLVIINMLAGGLTCIFGAIYILFQAIFLLGTSSSSRYVNRFRLALAVTFNIALLSSHFILSPDEVSWDWLRKRVGNKDFLNFTTAAQSLIVLLAFSLSKSLDFVQTAAAGYAIIGVVTFTTLSDPYSVYVISVILLFSVCNNLRCSMIFDEVLQCLWCIGFGCFALYVLTFYQDFQKLQLTITQEILIIEFRTQFLLDFPYEHQDELSNHL